MAQDLIDKIRAAAQAKNVDPDVAVKIAQAESSLNPEAGAKTSSAKGLFQIVNKTWAGAGGKPGQQKNPDENIRVGTDLIASNTDFLRKNLGRDPRASEVYAAHFFGPTGASTLLAAAPDTPAASLFSPAVLKANPQLQGKTADQIRGMLQQKMGETTTAPAPAKPTGPTPAEQMMEPALRSGMTASAEDLGSGYKAALALSFLGAEDANKPETDEDLQARLDREEEDAAAAEFAAYKPKNALADLQLSATSHLQQPVKMAAGGVPYTPSVGVKGTAREELDTIKSQYDKYNSAADAYNAALNKYKAEQYDPYIAAIAKYNAAAEEWNKGPRTTAFGMAAPTAPKEFTMTSPTAPAVSQADYEAKQAAAKQDMLHRQAAIDAASDPERYGLTINKFFADGGEADKEEKPMMADIPEQSNVNFIRAAHKQNIGDKQIENMMLGLGIDKATIGFNLSNLRQNDKDNLARSLMAAYNTKIGDVGVNAALMRPMDAPAGVYMGNLGASYPVGEGRIMAGVSAMRTPEGETQTMGHNLGYSGKVGPGYLNATMMQPRDNPQGRQYQMQYAVPFADGGDVMSSNMPLNPNPMAGTPELMMMHGGVVHRADGSPMGGENVDHLTPQEIERMAEAQRPAFVTPGSGRGRQQGPISQALTSGTAYPAMARGVAELPYDIAGAPVDLATMAMRPFGYKEEKPVLGSDWIKEKMTALGIRPGEETDPTLKGFRTFGELGANLVSPTAVARKTGTTAKELMSKVRASEAAPVAQDARIATAEQAAVEPATAGVQPQLALPAPPRQLALPAPAAAAAPAVEPVTQSAKMLKELPTAAPTPINPEFPMVGRLDMFVEGMKGPVQKEQFLNQVKNKFRDYDLDRVETALASFGPKDKITPTQLRDALSQTYSPSNLRSVDVPPSKVDYTYGLYNNMDNVYAPSKVGTTNLFINQPEPLREAHQMTTKIEEDLNSVYNFYAPPQRLEEIKNLLASNKQLANTPQAKAVETALNYIDKSYTSIKNAEKNLKDIEYGFLTPILYKDKAGNTLYFDLQREQKKVVAREMGHSAETASEWYKIPDDVRKAIDDEAARKAERIIMDEANARLQDMGGKPVNLSEINFVGSSDIGKATPGFKEMVTDAIEPIAMQAQEASNRIKRHIKPVIDDINKIIESDKLYLGQHPTVTKDPYPVGFARFTEHEVKIPGIGDVQGRHYHDLQSDLAQDIRAKGPKGGSVEKDTAEIDKLTQQKQKLMNDMVNNPPATEKERAAKDMELVKLEERLYRLGTRVSNARYIGPKYHLDEPFAGVDARPAVLQQLLMKNAIHAAIQDGKNFVTFPGTASAQSQLYEGVQNNLKQVIKDLGGEKAGFELRMIELPPTTAEVQSKRTGLPTHPKGTPLNAVGVVWGPAAAEKIKKTGVPFKDGGAVERVTTDNRRYL